VTRAEGQRGRGAEEQRSRGAEERRSKGERETTHPPDPPAFTGRAVSDDFAIPRSRHERLSRLQTSSEGALTGNTDLSIGMFT
jgi:hypothetical protein